jgi:hypothetical protein
LVRVSRNKSIKKLQQLACCNFLLNNKQRKATVVRGLIFENVGLKSTEEKTLT